ncbi:MAG: maintenance of mitochondrial structure and function-domain-containing protein [Benniella sp.]|nr:MAG: maintenance of mitochondrial structure and function-domain-containing protein [Benniella sp.]
MMDNTSTLHLALPAVYTVASAAVPVSTLAQPRAFSTSVNPLVFFSILDHYLRRNAGQDRVIGTLLGVRSEDGAEVEIKGCYPVPHLETQDQVEVDMEYHRTMFDLHKQVNPKEVIVGWYATGADLNSYSALIQDFYQKEVSSFPAVHLTMDTALTNERLGVKTYISAAVGITSKADNCMFIPIPCDVKYFKAERAGLELLASAKSSEDGSTTLLSDMDNLERAIIEVQSMLERVSQYVDAVLAGTVPANNTVGRYLMDTVSVVPKVDATEFEKMFNSHLQDLLMVIYLANMTRTQLAVAKRLEKLL